VSLSHRTTTMKRISLSQIPGENLARLAAGGHIPLNPMLPKGSMPYAAKRCSGVIIIGCGPILELNLCTIPKDYARPH
jgi:hypothetical protein